MVAALVAASGSRAAAAAGPGLSCSSGAGSRPVLAWEFEQAGDLEGWQPNGDLTQVRVADGTLCCRAVGGDPILEWRPLLDLAASPWHILEVRLKASRDGVAEVFWSNTSTGRYGGFSQTKTTRFNVPGDRRWHTCRVWPFWHSEQRIVRLRLDLYDGADFELDAIRVLEQPMPASPAGAHFEFTGSAAGWQALDGARIRPGSTGLTVTCPTPDAWMLAPPVRLPADDLNVLAVRLAADRPGRATLCFASDLSPGLHRFSFPVHPAGGERTYNLDLLAAPQWRGRIVALGFQPGDAPDATARVRWLRISDRPEGPPQLESIFFGVEDALPRAGRPAALAALIANTGGQPATNLHAVLTLPPGLKRLGPSPPQPAVASLQAGDELRLAWTVQAGQPLTNTLTLTLAADHTDIVRTSARVAISPPLGLPAARSVPEPEPVRGPFEVGVYYFPGWNSASRWQPVTRFPERKPVLGWYREGDPAVADWHIKWAVEHGITFFAYDWYWNRGARQLEHALHDGFFNARHRRHLKFCLLWANHNPPGTSSHADCLAVTRFWIDHYFRRPEHLTVDGKPVVILFSPHRLTEDLGSQGVKRAFDAMRAECRAAGLSGLHLIGCVAHAAEARRAAAEGYDAVTAYNWPGLGITGAARHAPFETLLEGYRRNWQDILDHSPLPLSPLPVSGGWDSRPWHGDHHLVRFGRTPDLFRRHLADARRVLEQRPSPGAVLIEAWNEWGEGSYVEPHREFGFAYLDAIRGVFAPGAGPHQDVTPADVGLGPYDVPPEEPRRTEWGFDHDRQGWAAMMHLADDRADAGVLSARTTGADPAFASPPLHARASAFGAVRLRLRLAPPDGRSYRDRGQLFWATTRLPESEANSATFDMAVDGAWHDYRVPVAQHRRWRGVITRLRLDPGNRPGVTVEVDHVRLDGASP